MAPAYGAKGGKMKCPNCGSKELTPFYYGGDTPFQICDDCGCRFQSDGQDYWNLSIPNLTRWRGFNEMPPYETDILVKCNNYGNWRIFVDQVYDEQNLSDLKKRNAKWLPLMEPEEKK
jgi:hypothetical protein